MTIIKDLSQLATAFETVSNNSTFTENGATAYASSLSKVLDMFSTAGAGRKHEPERIAETVKAAAAENIELALKCLFWARDARGGAGERRYFTLALRALIPDYIEQLKPLVKYIPEYGRWDDVLALLDTELRDAAVETLRAGFERSDALLAKWLPKNGKAATPVRKALGFTTPKAWRKALVEMNKVVESQMSAGRWDEITYKSVPSQAARIYKKAFAKHDAERYKQFLEDVKAGKTTIKAGTLFPYQISFDARNLSASDNSVATLDALWNALPNYLEGTDRTGLAVVDVSGSMFTALPGSKAQNVDVSISLGLYLGERAKGPFANTFISFSERPKLHVIQGENIREKVLNVQKEALGYNTDLNAVFKLLLKAAQASKAAADEMPDVIFVVSDMEFDSAVDGETNFDTIKKDFERAGYKLPKLVFWNLESRHGTQPVTKDEKGVALVSGFSAGMIKPLLRGEIFTPEHAMLDVLLSVRYSDIKVA